MYAVSAHTLLFSCNSCVHACGVMPFTRDSAVTSCAVLLSSNSTAAKLLKNGQFYLLWYSASLLHSMPLVCLAESLIQSALMYCKQLLSLCAGSSFEQP
jgi:hypothetical protein